MDAIPNHLIIGVTNLRGRSEQFGNGLGGPSLGGSYGLGRLSLDQCTLALPLSPLLSQRLNQSLSPGVKQDVG
jgi:hypothetical protein